MRWIIACMIGEAIGIAVVSLGYALGDRYYPGAAGVLILIAGACEGLSLGTAQAFAGRRFKINFAPWVAATTLAALIGYGLSLVGQGALSGDDAAPAGEPTLWQIIAGGAGLGLFMGLLFGGVQSAVLPAGISRVGWIARNAVGWIPAMAAIMIGASFAGADWPLGEVGLLGLVTGAAAGAFVGAATHGALKNGRE